MTVIIARKIYSFYHSTYVSVPSQVKNLRSTVARGAIACFGDLFNIMGKSMEQVGSVLIPWSDVVSTGHLQIWASTDAILNGSIM